MSTKEKNLPYNDVPRKLSKQEIMDAFQDDFDIQKIEDTIFRGAMELEPKALFVILKKK